MAYRNSLSYLLNLVVPFFPIVLLFGTLSFCINGAKVNIPEVYNYLVLVSGLFITSAAYLHGNKTNFHKALMILTALFVCTILTNGTDKTEITRFIIIIAIPLLLLVAFINMEPQALYKALPYLFISIALISVGSNILYLFSDLATYGNKNFSYICDDFNLLGTSVGQLYFERDWIHFDIRMYRPSGITHNPNYYSTLLAIAMLLFPLLEKQKYRVLYYLLLASMGFSFILTLSRSGFIMMTVAILFIAIIKKFRYLAIPFCIAITLSPILLFFLVSSVDFFVSNNVQHEIFFLGERGEIWRSILSNAQEFWLTGVGFGLSQEALLLPAGYQSSTFSTHLAIFAETGILGYLLMSTLWMGPVFILIKKLDLIQGSHKQNIGLCCSAILVGLYIHEVFDISIFRFHPLHFYFIFFLGTLIKTIYSPTLFIGAENTAKDVD